MTQQAPMRCRPYEQCFVCDGGGEMLYRDMPDRLFGAIGRWNLRRCTNRSCGLLWIDPLPVAEDLGQAYESYYTHADAAAPESWLRKAFIAIKRSYLASKYGYPNPLGKWAALLAPLAYLHPGRRAVMDFNVMWLSAQPGGKMLDVGCGSGALIAYMQALGWQAEGVDFDPQAAANAAAKGLRIHVGELAAQGFPEVTFDAITMSHFIEHVHDPLALLQECHRLLKPGGTLVAVTPNTESFGHALYASQWMHLDPPRHLHLFNTNTIATLAERSGFKNYRVFTSLRDAYGMFIGSRSIADTGKYTMGAGQPRSIKLWARWMELREWFRLKSRPNAGEELVLIARKSNQQ